MSFQRAARAALTGQSCRLRVLVAVVVVAVIVLAGLSLSCGSSGTQGTVPSHNAYVTLPATGQVLLLYINGMTGAMTAGPKTPAVQNISPTGLALSPSKKFLYVANSRANTISTFNVLPDGTLTLSGAPTQAGNGPYAAVIDPSGKYLLVTNTYGSNGDGGDVSVFSIDAGSGALSEVAGSPFPANTNPTEILITPSGQFVYVTSPGIGMVTAFSFSSGVLTTVPGSPFPSGAGASGLAVDASARFLYVANPAAINPSPYEATIGNISGFDIEPNGALSPMLGSPFTSTAGTGPTLLTVDPNGQFVYAVTTGSSDSIWCFTITSTNGQLVAATNSPFSLAAGTLFALFDPLGNFFYIGNSSGSSIDGYTYDPSTGALKAISDSPFSIGSAPGKMVFSQ
jgi:6-phosphogluconolactonase (cycloisomerase 2 family)